MTNETNENRIYRTNNYDKFKRLEGNREVDAKKVKKIKKSIEEVGYISNPIIVNENFEVIDGQHRLQALKELGKPIEYIIQKKLNIKEVLYMNVNQEKWSMMDYIKSHAELGNESYKRLLDLVELYPIYNLNTIGKAVKGINKLANKQIQNGGLEISQNEYEQAIIKLNYLNRYIPIFKYLLGRTTYFGQAIMVVYDMDNVDNKRLYKQITENVRTMTPYSDFITCLKSIEDIYNKNITFINRIDIYKQYRQSLIESSNRNVYANIKNIQPGYIRKRELARKIKLQDKVNKERGLNNEC